MTTSKYIKLEECKHSFLYKIFSRNLRFGVFNRGSCGFIGIREKFDEEYLDTEYHWDAGERCSAKPKELLEECFCLYDKGELFKWLKEKELEYQTRGDISGN